MGSETQPGSKPDDAPGDASTEARNGDGAVLVTVPRIARSAAVSSTSRVVARVIPTNSSRRSSA